MRTDDDGFEALLRDIADDGREWIATGTLDALEEHPKWGLIGTFTERPSGRQLQARVRWGATGDRAGLYSPPEPGDEAILFYPGGNPNRAIAMFGLTGGSRQIPSSYGDHVDLVHPGGLEVRTSQGAQVEPVVHATTFQGDLNDFLSALQLFLASSSTAAFAAQIAAAAATLQADPRFTTFLSRAGAGYYSAAALKSE